MSASEVAYYRSDRHDLWIGENNGYLILEGFVKNGDALRHLVSGIEDSRLDAAVDLVLRHGRRVRRPYRLWGACDGSIDAPAMALFLDFCRRHDLDADILYAQAYPDDPPLEQDAITDFAHWQGVLLPHTWTAACFAGLLASLTEINNHTLRGVLDEAAEGVTFPSGVQGRSGYVAFRGSTRCYGPSARFTWGYVITPTGEQVWQYDPWRSTNGRVPGHYWLSLLAVAARRDGDTLLAVSLIEEALRSARSPANRRHYRNWRESLEET